MKTERSRKVRGLDLEMLRQRIGASPKMIADALSINMNLYYELIKLKDQEITRAPVALMVRWYLSHPDDFPMPPKPSLEKIQKDLKDIGVDIEEREIVKLFGRGMTAYYRYKEGDDGRTINATSSSRAVMNLFRETIKKHGIKGFLEWVENVNSDILTEGRVNYELTIAKK